MFKKQKIFKYLEKILGSNYYKLLIEKQFFQNRNNKHPILIWQMGKVGSSSVYYSLQQIFNEKPVYHIHLLSKEMIEKGELYKRSLINGNNSYLYNNEFRKKFKSSMRRGVKWKIISLVREPVGRNISAFFQNIDIFLSEFDNKSESHIPESDISDIFFEKFDHQRPLEWFDKEIKSILGLDIYDEKFPISRGYKIYNEGSFDLLIIRMKDLDRVAEEAFTNFFDISKFELTNRNVGNEKLYSNLYNSIKKNIVFPKNYLDEMYQSKYAKHFFSDEELKLIRIKWE